MRTNLLALCLATVWTAGAHAQDVALANSQSTKDHGPKQCLMKSDAGTWDAVGLSATKRSKADLIVDHCNKEVAAKTEEARTPTEQEQEEMNKYVKDLKDLLSPAEFTRWEDWCADQGFEKEKEGKK